VGIFTHPQNLKITSSSSNGDDYEKLRKISELLKGSPIDDEQWNIKKKAIEELDKLLIKTESKVDVCSPVITVEKLIDTYESIDWMKLLNGIFGDRSIKLNDLVQVQNHQYFSQLSDAIRSQTNK
jgi:hypothetical protein